MYSPTLSLTSALDCVGVKATPRPLYPRVPIVEEAGWAPERSGRMLKISPSPGFDPQISNPIASRYTD
jgi:hypothetical protein